MPHDPLAMHFYIKLASTFALAIAILAPCGWFTVWPRAGKIIPVENFIAYNLTVFIVLGLAVTIIAADRWAAACIWAGAAMFGGAVFGVLFGIPTATDERNNQANRDAVKDANDRGEAAPPVLTPPRSHTLMSDTSSWMSKFLAGAGFAQAHTLLDYFLRLSRGISGYIMYPPVAPNVTAIGAAILLYFGILGFFCGLIVPYYYVKNLPQ